MGRVCTTKDSTIVWFVNTLCGLFLSLDYGNIHRISSPYVYLCVDGCRGTDKCHNKTICEEHLNLILPAKPPFHPRQFRTCAVVGNSGDLLKTEFGKEIDGHDAVIRDNEAPVNEVNLNV